MPEQKYLGQNGEIFYPITHTKSIYDNDGIVLENRLANMKSEAKSYTDTKVANLVNGAPETLDTLKEVADAIEANQDVVDALDDAIGNKANKTDVELALNDKANKTDVASALSAKLDTNGNSSDTTVTFEEIFTRNNINSGEKQSVLWGKVKKWFGSLKPIAFSSNYNDLNNAPEIPEAVAVKGDNESIYRTGNVNITKDNIGLGNVPNVTTDDQTPAYTQATTRENITSGEKLSVAFGKIKKWFSDLKTVAFTGSYNDLYDKPVIPQVNIKKNPDAEDGDIVDKHMTVGTRMPSQYGDYSFASGMSNIASGECSCTAGGTENEAREVDSAVLGGISNIASGSESVVVGGSTNTAIGENSVIIGGDGNKANNYRAVVIGGLNNIADEGFSVIVGGHNCFAKNSNVVFGHYNADPTAGRSVGTAGDALIVGNGTSANKSNAFRVAYNGNVYCAGEYGSTGADYAEMFEWADGNPDNEDRRGLFAYIENGRIRLASANDTDKRRLGVISARPAVVGDNFDDSWCGKYLTDIYGAVLTQIVHHEAEEYTVMVKDPETGERVPKTGIIEAYDAEEPILNPDYDPEREYIPRAQRKEYDCWAFLGKLVVRDDGTCQAGGYCYPNTGGIATACEDECKGFYVMERLDNNHIKVLIK